MRACAWSSRERWRTYPRRPRISSATSLRRWTAIGSCTCANTAGEEKARLLAGACALLAPLQWEEPFGLAMVEAMASGTPVIAMAKGAAPELITEGVTGFLVEDADAMTAAVSLVPAIDPSQCAAITRARFSPSVMAACVMPRAVT